MANRISKEYQVALLGLIQIEKGQVVRETPHDLRLDLVNFHILIRFI